MNTSPRVSRWATALAALAVVALATAGCTSLGADAAPKKLSDVTLNVGDQKAGSQALLQAAAQLRNLPYRIRWASFTSGPPLVEALNAGAIDVGGVGNTPPVFGAAAHSEFVAVAVTRGSLQGSAILVRNGSSIRQPGDLKGKRIAVAKGSSAHHLLLSVLLKNHLALKDVTISYLAPSDALAAFSSGQLDAWSIWDPYTAQAQATADARILLDANGYSNAYGFQVASRAALRNAPKTAAIKDYLVRLSRAQRWATTHAEQWAKTWTQQTGLPLSVTRVAASRRPASYVALDDTVIAAEQRLADDFADARLLPARIRFSDFVDRRFNAALTAS